MNQPNIRRSFVKVALSAMAATAFYPAHALNGVLEIRGAITSPGCQLGLQNMQRLAGQTQVSGQACGLTSQATSVMSNAIIAQVAEDSIGSPNVAAPSKRVLMLNYR